MPTQQEVNDAADTLYREVHVPAFFEKLANDYGIAPKTEQEAIAMLTQAEQLHQVFASTPTKQANLLEKGGKKIDALLKQAGFAGAAPTTQRVKAAAQGAARNRPDLAAAVLTLWAAQAAA